MKTKFSGILTLFLAFVVQLTFAQEKSISGTISDENGLPLPGVNIVVKGTTSGTQSDFDGNYAISANTGDVISYSFVGYKNVDRTVGAANTISFSMEVDVAAIDEVVITAMGIKRKKDEITSSYQVIKSEELTQANNPNAIQSLTGKVSGLQINQTSSGVAGGTTVILRGNRSISGDNQALFVIDGSISSANYFNSIDPNTIESVNVIKGASGSVLYGSQGSNGVIIVTTKKGATNEKFTVSYKSTVELEDVAYVPERQTRYGQGWAGANGFENIVYENGGWGAEFDGQMVPVGLPQADGTFIMTPYESQGSDNIKDFFKTGLTTQNSLTLAAGDSEGYINFSTQHLDREFVIEGDKIVRNNFSLQTGKRIDKIRFGAGATYINTGRERTFTGTTDEGIYLQLLQTPSNVPITAFENSGNEGHWNGYYTNPYWNRENQREDLDSERFNLSADVQYYINDNIDVLLRTNGNFNSQTTLQTQNGYEEPQAVIDITGNILNGIPGRNRSEQFYYYKSDYKLYTTDLLFNFDYMLTDDISLKSNVGGNMQYQKDEFVRVGGTDLTIPGIFTSGNLNTGFDNARTGDDRNTESRIGAFATAAFGYKDFLYLDLKARNDWSSVLAKANNSFFYPSVGVSFIPTKAFEGFGGRILNSAKVTASYVKVGNDGGVNAYDITPVFNQSSAFPLSGQNSFVNDLNITSPDIEPEFTSTYEFGINLGFLRDRFTLDAAYYSFTTDNQITLVGTSAAAGLSTSRINIGETEGSGFEIDLGAKIIDTENFNWNVNIGYQESDNKVVKVSDQASQVGLTTGGYVQVYAVEGQPFPLLQGSAFARDDQGRVIVNANGVPQTEALKNLGKTTPDYTVNLSSSVNYKNLTLSATMDYRTGHVFYSGNKQALTWSGHLVESAQGGRAGFIYPNSAVETSPGVYVANTSTVSGATNSSYISLYNTLSQIGENSVIDATAFKVREISLSYAFTKSNLENLGLDQLSIGAYARNPFTVLPSENRNYADPESSFSSGSNVAGIQDTSNFPPTRIFGLSLNLTF